MLYTLFVVCIPYSMRDTRDLQFVQTLWHASDASIYSLCPTNNQSDSSDYLNSEKCTFYNFQQHHVWPKHFPIIIVNKFTKCNCISACCMHLLYTYWHFTFYPRPYRRQPQRQSSPARYFSSINFVFILSGNL